MPIWLRKFTYHQIADTRQKEVDATNSQTQGSSIDMANPIKSNIPKEVLQPKKAPHYTTKASKK